jgi:hypothetical protein
LIQAFHFTSFFSLNERIFVLSLFRHFLIAKTAIGLSDAEFSQLWRSKRRPFDQALWADTWVRTLQRR